MGDERETELTNALQQVVPASFRNQIPSLCRFISQLIDQYQREGSSVKEVTIDNLLAKTLKELEGARIATQQAMVSFNHSDQEGEITIRDVAGGNITTVNLSLAFNETASGLNSKEKRKEYSSYVSELFSHSNQPMLSEDEWNELLINKPLYLASSDAKRIVPILGMDVSAAITGVALSDFIDQLIQQSGLTDKSPFIQDEQLPDLLHEVAQILGSHNFIATVQRLLRNSPRITTTTIQSIVTSRVRRIITLNLDYAIEDGYAIANTPLFPKNIGFGCRLEELSLFDQDTDEIVLIKLHGTLERPSSWILTREDYNHAYLEPGPLTLFFSGHNFVPLFIGFDDERYGLLQIVNLTGISNAKRSYAILPRGVAEKHFRMLSASGVTPIAYYNTDQIAEAIDKIFDCQDIEASKISAYSPESAFIQLQIGGTKVSISKNTVEEQEDIISRVTPILLNAFELKQFQGRKHGTKRLYLDRIVSLIKEKQLVALEITLQGITQYQDITETVLSHVLNRVDVDHFLFINALFKVYKSNPELSERLEYILLENLHNEMLSYRCLRNIAKVTASRGIHPGQRIPPVVTKVGNLAVTIYPLTRYQVGILLDNSELKRDNACFPYTILSTNEADEIIRRLRTATQQPWRLPTEEEWLLIAKARSQSWPWGTENPAYKVHAHLNYIGKGGHASSHPIEVGIFPKGQSIEGVFDLIGNVYDLVDLGTRGYGLAGGAWTTNFAEGKTHFVHVKLLAKGKNNVGIRPIMVAKD
jgi:hypothetical protein